MSLSSKRSRSIITTALVVGSLLIFGKSAIADESIKVTVDNFVRAETAAQFDRILQMTGGINQFAHLREPTPLDKQNVIRMNRDTLYSATIVDISKGATLTVPDAGGRYLSIMVVNEDHYINKVIHEPGEHQLTVEEYGTPFVNLSVRTLVNASDPDDIAKANALQDQLKIKTKSAKPYTHPSYDEETYKVTYEALLILGKGMTDTSATFGKKEDVDPVRHLLGTAWGWGGLPAEEAYSVNDMTAKPNEDGLLTIHFGGAPESLNHLPITEGWNYTVRFYQPRKEILEGKWIFPGVKPAQ